MTKKKKKKDPHCTILQCPYLLLILNSCVVVCGVFSYISVSKQKEAFWILQVLMLSSNQPPLQSVGHRTSQLQWTASALPGCFCLLLEVVVGLP